MDVVRHDLYEQYARAFNMSAECLINNSSTSKRFLHKVQYERIKEECPTLPTGLIQCARDVAVEAVKNWNCSGSCQELESEEDEAEAEASEEGREDEKTLDEGEVHDAL